MNPQVPDTLDLCSRARAALNYFVQNPDREALFQPYFISNLEADPPYLEHSEWDFGDVSSRFAEAITYIRLMTGDPSGEEVEAGLREFVLSWLSPEDGLLWRPASQYGLYQPASSGGNAGAYIWDQGRALYALLAWFMTTREDRVLRKLQRLVDGLGRIAVQKQDHGSQSSYFPSECYLGQGRWSDHPLMWVPDGQVVEPLVRYFELTGDHTALDLAHRLARSVLGREPRTFGPGGEMFRDDHNTHFHSRTAALVGLLRLAVATGDEELAAFVERAYLWARAQGSSFGWVPEQLRTVKWSETCSIADMINLAVMLAEARHPEYWEDVERFVRNCLAESQVLSAEMLPQPWRKVPGKAPGSRSSDRVPERVMGGFVGSVFPNDRHFEADWNDGFGISGCCTPAAAKSLYLAWSHIVTREPNDVRVNLALSADTPWLRVLSHHPYQGRLEIRMKDARQVLVRVPGWAARDNVELTVNGVRHDVVWERNYVSADHLRSGDDVVVSYPMVSLEKTERVAGQDYRVRWRGDTVVALSPPGRRMPLYQRKELERDVAPVKLVPVEPENRTRDLREPMHLW